MITSQDEEFLALNIKGLMMSCSTLISNNMQAQYNNSEQLDISEGDLRTFSHLRGRTMTMSQLAKERNISRQGTQQSIKRLIEADMVKLTQGNNAKEKHIIITQKGNDFRKKIAQQLKLQEIEISRMLGVKKTDNLKNILAELFDVLSSSNKIKE